jgi:hypothetical protein
MRLGAIRRSALPPLMVVTGALSRLSVFITRSSMRNALIVGRVNESTPLLRRYVEADVDILGID